MGWLFCCVFRDTFAVYLTRGQAFLLHLKLHSLHVAAVRADHNLELARLKHEIEVVVIELQHIWSKLEGHFLALASLEMDALEAFELLHGASHTGVKIADIELHYLAG